MIYDYFLSYLVNLSYKNEYILLKKWLKEKGYKNNNLNPAVFAGNFLITFLEVLTSESLQKM